MNESNYPKIALLQIREWLQVTQKHHYTSLNHHLLMVKHGLNMFKQLLFPISNRFLVGGLEHFLFFHILRIVTPSDYCNIFQRGWNHQPALKRSSIVVFPKRQGVSQRLGDAGDSCEDAQFLGCPGRAQKISGSYITHKTKWLYSDIYICKCICICICRCICICICRCICICICILYIICYYIISYYSAHIV